MSGWPLAFTIVGVTWCLVFGLAVAGVIWLMRRDW